MKIITRGQAGKILCSERFPGQVQSRGQSQGLPPELIGLSCPKLFCQNPDRFHRYLRLLSWEFSKGREGFLPLSAPFLPGGCRVFARMAEVRLPLIFLTLLCGREVFALFARVASM